MLLLNCSVPSPLWRGGVLPEIADKQRHRIVQRWTRQYGTVLGYGFLWNHVSEKSTSRTRYVMQRLQWHVQDQLLSGAMWACSLYTFSLGQTNFTHVLALQTLVISDPTMAAQVLGPGAWKRHGLDKSYVVLYK